jgi:hypothetical protein
MPDWEELVSARLGPLDGDERQQAGIVGELAGHLEDEYGALGAYLSRRGGGERRARLVAGVFPALMFLCSLSFVGVTAVFVEHNQFVLDHPLYFATMIFPWVIFPGLALALGVLPFLREGRSDLAVQL